MINKGWLIKKTHQYQNEIQTLPQLDIINVLK